MRQHTPFAAIATLAAFAALAGLGIGVASGAERRPVRADAGATVPKPCSGLKSGPRYSIFAGTSSTQYIVWNKGVSCAFATTWMRKLAPRKISTRGTTTLTGGPAGYRCVAQGGNGRKTAVEVACRASGKSFGWGTPALATG